MASSAFAIGTKVWIKQEGYPWWPGLIVDAAAVDLPAPVPPQEYCVQCLPSTAPTCAYATGSDAELRPWLGPGTADDALIADGLADGDCAVAVKEMLAAESSASGTGAVAAVGIKSEEDSDDDAAVLGLAGAGDDAARAAKEQRRQKKLERRMKRQAREEAEAAAAAKRVKTEPKGHKSRQSQLDEYQRQADQPPRYSPDDDAAYFYRSKLKTIRQPVSNATLVECGAKLTSVIAMCLHDGYDLHEEEILSCLRALAAYDVTYEQLAATRIGAVVGQLLKKSFTPRVIELANGVLTCWFQRLPQGMQKEFSDNSQLDLCSVETVGDRSDTVDARLGVVGVHLFESFTEEELYDAPPNVNVVELCHRIENALQEAHADDRDTRVLVLTTFGDAANSALRRAVLDGKVTEEDISANATDLMTLVARTNPRGLRDIVTDFSAVGSPTLASPRSGGSPMASFSSPTGRGSMGNITSAYNCPSCGAHDAYRTVYSVQAHDNYPDILRCRKCDTTWNVTNL